VEHEASFGSLDQRLLEQLFIGRLADWPIGQLQCFHDEMHGRAGMLSTTVWHKVTHKKRIAVMTEMRERDYNALASQQV
jgi:hypothetical protein